MSSEGIDSLANPSLHGALRKHRRAVEHWQALCEELTTFAQAHVSMTVEPREGTAQYGELTITSPVESSLEVIAGDCIQNLRAALDYLAWELAFDALGRPPTSAERTQFPIATTGASYFRAARHQIRWLRGEHRRIIRKMQPYQSSNPLQHPLALLNRLSNSDKHRLLSLTVSHVREISVRPKEYAGGEIHVLPLFMKATPSVKERLEFDAGLHAIAWVSFEFEDEDRRPVVETLSELLEHVKLILDRFDALIAKS